MPELSPVHIQRLRAAVAAARVGARIVFVLLPTEPPTIAWRDPKKPRVQHVILNAFGATARWKAAVETKFQEMLCEQ